MTQITRPASWIVRYNLRYSSCHHYRHRRGRNQAHHPAVPDGPSG